MEQLTDSEILNRLEHYIQENKYILIHNTTGSSDPNWPAGYRGGGVGLMPFSPRPRSLREALSYLPPAQQA